jgi:hypothetical protein
VLVIAAAAVRGLLQRVLGKDEFRVVSALGGQEVLSALNGQL